MNRLLFPFTSPKQGTVPVKFANTFRDAAVSFDSDMTNSLTLVRRLVDLHLNGALWVGSSSTANAYNLLVLNLLLPGEAGIVVMSSQQQRQLSAYLNCQLYLIVRDKQSPFYDVPAQTLYNALLEVSYVVENYTSIVNFWPCTT